MASEITLVITACERNDLLKQMMDSFIAVGCGGLKPEPLHHRGGQREPYARLAGT